MSMTDTSLFLDSRRRQYASSSFIYDLQAPETATGTDVFDNDDYSQNVVSPFFHRLS